MCVDPQLKVVPTCQAHVVDGPRQAYFYFCFLNYVCQQLQCPAVLGDYWPLKKNITKLYICTPYLKFDTFSRNEWFWGR